MTTTCGPPVLQLLGLLGMVDAASQELSGMGGGGRERGRGEEGKEEVENNRERATGVETGRNKQKSKMSM